MADLADGESVEVQGSARDPYVLKNVGGVYSCSCPAWRHQGGTLDRRTCKHLKKLRGEAAEAARVGVPLSAGAAGGVASKTPKASKPSTSSSGNSSAHVGSTAGGGKAPPLLLAHKWANDVDLVGWWMSEKLDGVRAYWDGSGFISRLGNPFLAPDWFVEGLPKTPLDGELWGGRKQFQKTISVVRRGDMSDAWKQVRYLVFDAPHLASPFEERLKHVEQHVGKNKLGFAEAHLHERCSGLSHLKTELARVESLGGEGLMLRRPGSTYEVGRSSSLLKVKSFHDAEATVIAHEPGKGKHKGRVGALVVRMPNGITFNVGTGLSDAERASPPPIGAVITYRYQELTNDGVPRFPSYVGVRIDGGPTMPS